ncbi:hypothetical protein AX774_g7784 [Zancudomyces culisetae]|uniref:Uncharacterized protein n=1 Tax=Zancudomyces culisetae TaxID=1213189 RepID=A0A1R1PCW5_ZANCU|nr:hypothetical protein AX774_g7784 [Zancudomyces culisetae]|eukprot:OMH78816.1 hypothetical protein AX774_g7784 [Zancudomyces culisetae]
MKKKSPREGKAYLKDWNTVIEGFLNQFSPPKSSGLLGDEDEQIGGRHELEAGDQEEKVDSRMVSGWQIMTREAVVDAQHRFPTFCEELEQLYDEKKLEKRLWQEGEGEESRSLVVLNEVITEMQEYPILLKYGGLKGKIGRTVRNQYESMMSRRLVKVLDTLMLYFDNVMYKAKGSAAGNSTYGSQKQERKQEKADEELEEGKNGSSGHSMELFATLNIYPKKTGDVQGRNEQKAELDVLKYDEDSLTVLYRKCVDEILMVFVKTVGNEMANFYYYYSIEAEILRVQSLDAGSGLGLAADTSKNLFKLRTYFHVLEYLVLTVFGESNGHQQSNREGLVGRTSSVINEYETRVHEGQQRELLLIGNKSEMVKSPPVSTSGAIALKSPGFYQLRNSSQQTQSPNNMIPVSRTLSNMNVGTKMMYNRSPTITTETGLSQASYSSPIMAANVMMMEKSRSFLYNERLKSITGSTKSITTSISNLNSAAAAAASVGGVGGSSNPGNARNEDASLLLILNNIDKLFTERHEIYPKTVVYSVKINPTVNIEQQMEQQLGVLILVHIINIMLKGVLELVLAYGIGLLCHDGAVVDLLRANLVTELKSWIMEIYYNGNGITNSTSSAGGTIDSNVNSPSINANNLNKSQQRNYTGVKQDQYLKSSSTDFSLLVNIINEIEIILTSRL